MVEEVLKQRGRTYGSFKDIARTSRSLKYMCNNTQGRKLSCIEQESLEMILHKIARILHGKQHKDNWIDIAGYALLVAREMEKNEHNRERST